MLKIYAINSIARFEKVAENLNYIIRYSKNTILETYNF